MILQSNGYPLSNHGNDPNQVLHIDIRMSVAVKTLHIDFVLLNKAMLSFQNAQYITEIFPIPPWERVEQ
jgi:hypothetical protein